MTGVNMFILPFFHHATAAVSSHWSSLKLNVHAPVVIVMAKKPDFQINFLS